MAHHSGENEQAAESDGSTYWARTACILCECNCGLQVKVDDGRIASVRGDRDHPVSAGYTCEKPLRLDKYQNGPHRLDTPLRRQPDGSYEEIDWDTALDEIAARLAAIRDRHGGESIFYYGGGGQGNHLGGGYGRAWMEALGVRYMANALSQEKTGEGWVDRQLYGNHTVGDFDNAEVAVFVGKNPWQSHGVARARPVLKEIARDPQRAIVVIDPRRSETAAMADHHLQIKPGTDAWCVSALAAVLVQEELHARNWLDRHTVGADEVLAALRRIDVTTHARRCGVDEEQIRTVARRIATASSVATYEDLGVQHSPNSTLVSYQIKLLWLLTGNFARPGGMHIHSWVFPVAGRWHPVPSAERRPEPARAHRALGTVLMRHGAKPMRRLAALVARHRWAGAAFDRGARLGLRAFFNAVSVPAARRISEALARSEFDGRTPVSGARVFGGLTPCNAITDEILTDHPDRLRAMWVDGANPGHTLAESGRFAEAMRSLELSVVVDVAMTETAREADYVLPAASQFEKHESSLFTLHFPHNGFQLRAPIMPALPGTRSEPEIYAGVIDRLGVVEQKLLDELTAAARISRHAFALVFFSTIENRPELAGLAPYLLYRTLGETLPEGDRSVGLIWGMAHLATIAQPDAAARAGFTAHGFDQGEELFEAFHTRREGVTFAEDRYEDAWGYVQHPDGRIHLAIPMLLDELDRISGVEPSYTSDEFPFTLSAGERRSFTANVIYRDPGWRRRDVEGALRLAAADAQALGVDTGDRVRIVTETGSAEAPVEVTDMMQAGHISLPNGYGVSFPDGDGGESTVGVSTNALTSGARRDQFFGTPWHKNVPARLEVVLTSKDPAADRVEGSLPA